MWWCANANANADPDADADANTNANADTDTNSVSVSDAGNHPEFDGCHELRDAGTIGLGADRVDERRQ